MEVGSAARQRAQLMPPVGPVPGHLRRRLECYQCCAARPKDPQRVTIDPEGPSLILKVSNLDDDARLVDWSGLVGPLGLL